MKDASSLRIKIDLASSYTSYMVASFAWAFGYLN